ncbi:MAG: T9SS type A sorting domain-containing protein, partial [Bacteroidetes bacterium]|nr:T9SS type A sorting domain-containing protein [Bacteroidota bacterium]
GNRGARVVFDMTGMKDANDTAHKFHLTDIYGYEFTWEAGDTLFFYNLDVMLEQPQTERWKWLARPDSLLTPFAKLVTGGSSAGKWRNVTVDENVRYILVRWLPRNRGSYYTLPDFKELCLYGKYLYDTATVTDVRPESYMGPLPSKKTKDQTYGAFVGTNLGQGFDTLSMAYDGNIRVYGSTNYWDKDVTASTISSIKYTFDAFPDIGPTQYAAYKRAGKKVWWSIRGASSYINSIVPGGTGVNIDNWWSDPENPFNYSRDADFYFNYGAKFGNVKVSAGLTKWLGDASNSNGQNTLNYVENGNEEDAHGVSQLAYWARSVCDYDGYEGRVGVAGRSGLKAADPGFKMIMSATMEIDTAVVDNFVWFSKLMRADGKLPFDVINFHHYPRTTNVLGYAPGYEQEVGSHGESPEADDVLNGYTASAKAIYNYVDGDTSIRIINTEYGYGNWGTVAATPIQASYPWDFGCLPSSGGWDSLQLKALLMARSELIMPFTPYSGYNEYFFHNSSFGANNFMLFSSYGRTTGRDNVKWRPTTFFPWWYYRAGLYNHLKDYYPDAVVQNGGTSGMWITRWRNINNPDSTCYAVWKGSYNGSSLSNQSIFVDSVLGGRVNQVELSFSDINGISTPITGSGGYINVNVYERPILYFFQKDTASISNKPPVANAGADQLLASPAPVTLDGSASYDPDGSIVQYSWTQTAGPAATLTNANSPILSVTGLANGNTYTFFLTVTDNQGAIGRAQVNVTVGPPPNQAPVADAGADIVIPVPAPVTLDGSASHDPDGSIVSWHWVQKLGAVAAISDPNIAKPVITGLSAGLYQFELTVTDNSGATAVSTVNVTVQQNANVPPVADAGPDQQISLPGMTTLNGSGSSDPDGGISIYSWRQVSGPATATIKNPNTATSSIVAPVAGTYVFELTVTDNRGATATDQVTITVIGAAPGSVVAVAGPDQVVNFPLNTSALLDGKASYSKDGTITTYQWKQLTGPASSGLSQPNNVSTLAGSLQAGDFTYELTVTDDKGGVGKDTVKLMVVVDLRYTNLITVYPNPVRGNTVTIDAMNDMTGKVFISLYDAAGRRLLSDIYDKQAQKFRQVINIGQLAKGAYFIQIRFGIEGQPYSYTIVKE